VRVDQLEPIANRLYALALQFNGVPDSVQSFAEWKGAKLDESLLDVVVRAYEALLTIAPSYRTRISLARALGFMQRWDDATQGYARLFEGENFINISTRSIDSSVLSEKPELAFALLEWGLCEHELGTSHGLPDKLVRASNIFEALVTGTREATPIWWAAKYYFILTLSDRGEYDTAKIAIRDMGRRYPDYDGGAFKERYERLAADLKKK
jgi:tetratricopeptide (TPR) repeat protein